MERASCEIIMHCAFNWMSPYPSHPILAPRASDTLFRRGSEGGLNRAKAKRSGSGAAQRREQTRQRSSRAAVLMRI